MNELASQFLSPHAAWRGKPFWSWNGELDEAELIRQIHVMKEMGLGGFFMHSRTGLVTEYLGDEWFRLTNACADEAARLGMEAWLYDEDRWPSGTAGGMVTEDPAFRMNFMRLRPVPGREFAWIEGLVAAFSCRLDGTAYSECERIGPDTPAAAYQDKTVLTFAIEAMEPSSFYNGYTYVDTLNKAATEHYIQLTHEQYKARCGDHLGKTIQGIFTDEPHRGAVMTGFGVPNEGRLWMTPWTETLAARFQEQFGEDIISRLPELFLLPGGEAVSPVKWQYMELLQQMFLENFAKPLYDWCDANNMRLTGHALHEDSLTCQAAMQGSLMRFYEYQHDPGVDVLSEGNRNPIIVKQLASAARQLGRKWLLSELYGCTGWQMNFRSHKEVGDWQALFGINLRCHHLSWYTMEGEAKRDYPASILHQSAWWKDYDYVESYFARLGLLLAEGKPRCDILVLNPVESLWCQIHVGWAEGLSPLTRPVQELEAAYTELSTWLLGAHLDYDYGDEEMLSRLASISRGEDGNPVIHVGQAAYRALVVPRMTTLRSSTLHLLEEFLQAGGKVIFAGEPPAYVDAERSTQAADLAARAMHVSWEQSQVLAACQKATPADVEIREADTGAVIPGIFCQLRAEGERRVLVALNTGPNETYGRVLIRLRGQGSVEEWDCRSGQRWAVSSRALGEWVEFETDFAPSGERAFVLTPQRDETLPLAPVYQEEAQTTCAGPYNYTLGEENVCVLDVARWRLDRGGWQEAAEILKVDQAVRRALDLPLRGGEMVQPWFHRKYHPRPEAHARLTMAFEFEVAATSIGPVSLCLERPQQWTISMNGQIIPSHAESWWVDTAFQRITLPPGALQAGQNELTLEADFHEEINIESIYLVGDFAVQLSGTRKTLTQQPERLTVGDITGQGFPFYGGAVTYQIPLPARPAGQKLWLTVPEFEAACVKVQSDVIAFPPYRAEIMSEDVVSLEVVLTRRNTFGPLHQIPLRADGYGPGNFTTAGANFSENYMLYPAGLLAAPVLSW